jgi:hypothetical protein
MSLDCFLQLFLHSLLTHASHLCLEPQGCFWQNSPRMVLVEMVLAIWKGKKYKTRPWSNIWQVTFLSSASSITTTMSENTPPTFDFLDKFPTEIRDMIFEYMIQNTIESYKQQPCYTFPLVACNQINTQGISVIDAKSHLIRSPWITLNKQYCAEYLQVFVREVELTARFTSQLTRPRFGIIRTEPHRLTEPKDVLQLITHRFNLAGPYAGIDTRSQTLLSRIKSVCLSYHYWGSFFERGFGRTDRRDFPIDDFLTSPLKILRQCHEHYKIPAEKLSIQISYGDPSWTVLACLALLDGGRHSVVSLCPVQAQIYVDNRDASVAVIDCELEVLREAVGQIIEKMRIRYPQSHHLRLIMRSKDLIDRDMVLLRRRHLEGIEKVTMFWKARDGGY